ncbi:MAG: hypothetical protein ABIQ93_03820 [Saprospiraceae bacterium]
MSFLGLADSLRAQSPALQIFPDSAHNKACPNVVSTYYIFPWSLGCQLINTWQEGPSRRVDKAMVDFPNGLYTLRATVITKRLMIARLF